MACSIVCVDVQTNWMDSEGGGETQQQPWRRTVSWENLA